MSLKKKAVLLWLLVPVCLVITVALRIAMDRVEVDYKEVQATVLSSRTVQRRIAGSTMTTYEVRVSYLGREYDLKNAHNSYSFRQGQTVTAYLSNGKLYANVEGITSTTPVAILYFVFLFGTFGLLIGVPLYLDREKKKLAAAQERARRKIQDFQDGPSETGYQRWGS